MVACAWEHGWVSNGIARNRPSPRPIALTFHPPGWIYSICWVCWVCWVYSIYPPKNSNIPYWYCLQCTPSLTLPPSSLKCLQKSNPNIHIKCFRCFRCFKFAFGPKKRLFLVQIGTKPVFQVFESFQIRSQISPAGRYMPQVCNGSPSPKTPHIIYIAKEPPSVPRK